MNDERPNLRMQSTDGEGLNQLLLSADRSKIARAREILPALLRAVASGIQTRQRAAHSVYQQDCVGHMPNMYARGIMAQPGLRSDYSSSLETNHFTLLAIDRRFSVWRQYDDTIRDVTNVRDSVRDVESCVLAWVDKRSRQNGTVTFAFGSVGHVASA